MADKSKTETEFRWDALNAMVKILESEPSEVSTSNKIKAAKVILMCTEPPIPDGEMA